MNKLINKKLKTLPKLDDCDVFEYRGVYVLRGADTTAFLSVRPVEYGVEIEAIGNYLNSNYEEMGLGEEPELEEIQGYLLENGVLSVNEDRVATKYIPSLIDDLYTNLFPVQEWVKGGNND